MNIYTINVNWAVHIFLTIQKFDLKHRKSTQSMFLDVPSNVKLFLGQFGCNDDDTVLLPDNYKEVNWSRKWENSRPV